MANRWTSEGNDGCYELQNRVQITFVCEMERNASWTLVRGMWLRKRSVR